MSNFRSFHLVPGSLLLLAAACGGGPPSPGAERSASTAQAVENVSWDDYQSLGGVVGYPLGLSAAVDATGAVGVATLGTYGHIYVNFEGHPDDQWQVPSFAGYIDLGPYGTSPPTMVLDASGRLSVFVRGGDGALWVKYEQAPGDHFVNSTWTSLGSSSSCGRRMTTSTKRGETWG